METRLFNYDEFVWKYREDPISRYEIERYEEKFGIKRCSVIEEHPFYHQHLSRFSTAFEIVTPPKVAMSQQDWDLLAKLIFGSISSTFLLILDEDWKIKPIGKPIKAQVRIHVSRNGKNITILLSELNASQIKRIFDAYVKEQIEIFLLLKEKNGDYGWVNNYSAIGLEIEGEDYESWRAKQQLDLRYKIYERQKENLLSDAEFYKNIYGEILW